MLKHLIIKRCETEILFGVRWDDIYYGIKMPIGVTLQRNYRKVQHSIIIIFFVIETQKHEQKIKNWKKIFLFFSLVKQKLCMVLVFFLFSLENKITRIKNATNFCFNWNWWQVTVQLLFGFCGKKIVEGLHFPLFERLHSLNISSFIYAAQNLKFIQLRAVLWNMFCDTISLFVLVLVRFS